MARMTAADAAVAILRAEGVTHAFGVPGAAINPLYAAMRRDGGIDHVLARHVEGASHMADGYTRTRAGNIAHITPEAADGGPIRTARSASRTCSESSSAVEYTATASTPSSCRARITRTAISPRFATRTRLNTGGA